MKMKQRVLERARNTVETVLRKHCADTTLEMLRMFPEVNGRGGRPPPPPPPRAWVLGCVGRALSSAGLRMLRHG